MYGCKYGEGKQKEAQTSSEVEEWMLHFRNCLRLGGSCGYPNDVSSDGSELLVESPPLEDVLVQTDSYSLSPLTIVEGGGVTYDPFDVLPASISYQSHRFIDHCSFAVSALLELKFECRNKVNNYQIKNYRILVHAPPPGGAVGGKVWSFAMSDPIFLHGALLLTAEHMKVVGDKSPDLEPALLHHKVEVIRLVNERLGDPSMAISDGTVGGIACLAILESLHGANQVAEMHLNGLEQLMKMRGGIRNTENGEVLQQLIMLSDVLTASALHTSSRFSIDVAADDDESFPTTDVIFSGNLGHHNVADITYYELTNGLDSDTSKMFLELRTISYHIGAQQHHTTAISVGDRVGEVRKYIAEKISAAGKCAIGRGTIVSKLITCYIAGSLYLHHLLLKAPRENFIVSQALSHLKRVLESSKDLGPHLILPADLLFWVLFVACAAARGGPESTWFFQRLASCRMELEIGGWEEAKEMLWRFAWVPYVGDEIGEQIWEEVDGYDICMMMQDGG